MPNRHTSRECVQKFILRINLFDKRTANSKNINSATHAIRINILHATMLAMVRAVEGLIITPEFVRVDGNRLPQWQYSAEAVVKGDSKHAEISAASIIAKVARDDDMIALDKLHPEYGFAAHKGYPTKAHFEAIARYGVLSCYRKSFKPVQAVLAGPEAAAK